MCSPVTPGVRGPAAFGQTVRVSYGVRIGASRARVRFRCVRAGLWKVAGAVDGAVGGRARRPCGRSRRTRRVPGCRDRSGRRSRAHHHAVVVPRQRGFADQRQSPLNESSVLRRGTPARPVLRPCQTCLVRRHPVPRRCLPVEDQAVPHDRCRTSDAQIHAPVEICDPLQTHFILEEAIS